MHPLPLLTFIPRLADAGLALVVAAAAAVAIAAAAGATPHVEASDSMRPLLRSGDVLWLDRIRAVEARAGDVVAFTRPERGDVVLHRVRRIRREHGGRLSFTTRGDANTAAEAWSIPADATLGRYAGVRVPAVGRWLRERERLAALVVVALGALILRRVWR